MVERRGSNWPGENDQIPAWTLNEKPVPSWKLARMRSLLNKQMDAWNNTIGLNVADGGLHVTDAVATTNVANPMADYNITTSGTPAADFGGYLSHLMHSDGNNPAEALRFQYQWTDATDGAEDSKFLLQLSTAGSLATVLEISDVGVVTISDLTAGAGNDLTIKLGDAAGTNEILITDSADAERATIDSDGNAFFAGALGVAAAPITPLYVELGAGGSTARSFRLDASGGSTAGTMLIYPATDAANPAWTWFTNGSEDIVLKPGNNVTLTAQASTGRVRIGSAMSPSSLLDVGGDIEVGTADYIYFGDPGADGSLRISNDGTSLFTELRAGGVWS